jgi:hypothetical protein
MAYGFYPGKWLGHRPPTTFHHLEKPMKAESRYTTSLASKQGAQWRVLKWGYHDELSESPEWRQVGPFFDTELEAEMFITSLEKKDYDTEALEKEDYDPES